MEHIINGCLTGLLWTKINRENCIAILIGKKYAHIFLVLLVAVNTTPLSHFLPEFFQISIVLQISKFQIPFISLQFPRQC